MRGSTWLACAAAAFLLVPERAEACSYFIPPEHELDPAHADDTTPPTIGNGSAIVSRSEEPPCGGAGDCGAHLGVRISFEVGDDRTAAREIGYELAIVSGDSGGLVTRPGVFGSWGEGVLDLGTRNDGQDLDCVVSIVAVDKNGNRSAPLLVHVVDNEGMGCSMGGVRGGHTSALLVVLAALIAIRSRGGATARCAGTPRVAAGGADRG